MSQPLRIVVADDDADLRQYYGRIIPHLGHKLLDIASDGQQLVAACRRLRPDLVITDIRMPNLDGISAMESVQREAGIPFILVSADDEADHRQRLKRSKVLDYLQKPMRQSQLVAAIEAASACQAHNDGSTGDSRSMST